MKQLFLVMSVLLAQNSFAWGNPKRMSPHNIRPTHKTKKEIALTFDDGPTPRVTAQVLDILRKYNVPATFFVIGQKGIARRDLLQRELDEGHIVANHSFSHKLVGKMSFWGFKKNIKKEFFKAHEVIKDYAGNGRYFYYRAPGSSWKEKATKIINQSDIGQQYIGPVLWDIGGELHKTSTGIYAQAADWACWSHKLTVNQCLEGYINRTKQQQGGIVLMHDLNPKTPKMLDKYIQKLLELGYTFVTLDDMQLKK